MCKTNRHILEKYNEIFQSLRKNNNFTQEEFAIELGISRSLIAKIEAGKHVISRNILDKLSKKFPNDKRIAALGFSTNVFTIDKSVMDYMNDQFESQFIKSNEFKTRLSAVAILLDDNMKFFYFIINILKKLDHNFTQKEKKEIEFYHKLEITLSEIKYNELIINKKEFESIEYHIKSSLFSFINSLMFRVSDLLEFHPTFDFEELMKDIK